MKLWKYGMVRNTGLAEIAVKCAQKLIPLTPCRKSVLRQELASLRRSFSPRQWPLYGALHLSCR